MGSVTHRSGRSKYSILGILTIEPMTGYDIRKFVNASIAHFWRESYGSIYPVLKQLMNEGLVTLRLRVGRGKPSRRIYSITKRGREELCGWLAEPSEEEALRSEILLKLFFGHLLPLEAVIRHMRDECTRQGRKLKAMERIRGDLLAGQRSNPNLPYWLMTLRRGLLVAEARVRWSEECLASLSKLERSSKTRVASLRSLRSKADQKGD